MGDVRSDFMVENTLHRGLVDRGHGDDADVRRSTVTCADERREEGPLAGRVTVRIGNRSMRMDLWADRGAGVAAVLLRPSRSIRCSRACD